MAATFGAAWDAAAHRAPDAVALVHGDSETTWGAFERRAAGLAAALLHAGLEPGDHVAQYLYSGPEYLETVYACFKAGLVPVNTNYRYGDEELTYLWTNADVRAVVFGHEFGPTVRRLAPLLPGVRHWLAVPEDYRAAVAGPPLRDAPEHDDTLYLLYTGGTTGMPRGVMWRQSDLIGYLLGASPTAPGTVAGVPARPYVHLSASPLMHGTGSFTAFQALCMGGTVVTLAGRSFDSHELLDVVDTRTVETVALVGDAFCLPLLDALDRDPARWQLDSLRWIASSGALWSADVKMRMLEHCPRLVLIDSLASSEAPGMASSITTRGTTPRPGEFTAGPATLLVDAERRPLAVGSDEPGLVAVSGHLPIGYYKDPEKTGTTFVIHDDRRYSVPGDWATLDEDRTLHLLGRGASTINTGGEKVFAEEVEQVIRAHEDIDDAVVVGVPDPRLGERIVAVVASATDRRPSELELVAHVKAHLAGYKAPKRVVFVAAIPRGPSGKVDYAAVRDAAARVA